ncbi:MAG: peptidoglycan editing factor PgeF [Armatimonadetes bacterium]|jgi:YfiH family protein|nr:peptidoglycan editing factor PgeF [Armatimonadota bacterium]
MNNPDWLTIDAGGLPRYVPRRFEDSQLVNCGFSTRTGGVSKPPYHSLNLSLAVGDDRDDVLANRRLFASGLGVDAAAIVVPDQIHSNRVAIVTQSDAGSGAIDHCDAVPATDALITNTVGLPLALHFADCVGILFLDPVNSAIGAAHAGWRGTAANIVQVVIDAMKCEFGTYTANLLAAICPAIEGNCYEVGDDVAYHFEEMFSGDKSVLGRCENTKWRVDLKMANCVLLRRAGVREMNVALSRQCTSCRDDEFFSYRRDGVTGRMGGWISLKRM